MRLLLTRPRPDSEALAAELADRGIDCLIAPALEIEETRAAALPLDSVRAVLVTSGNGARAFARATARRDLRVFAVGERTAAVLDAAGFREVESADGAAGDLAALVGRTLDPDDGPLLHVRGRDVGGDLEGRLEVFGFTVEEAELYRAEPVTALPDAAAEGLRAGTVDAALFFSPRSAATFVSLAGAAGLDGACRTVTALCLSRAVAREAEAVPWRQVLVAARPRKADLLALLDRLGGARQHEV